ncbi:MAG: hypothetical protein ACI85Q_002098 [Salibacteraceae bacterium]|jgi:hypothetical protein
MNNLNKIKSVVRTKNKPAGISKRVWANSINWTIEAWKCYISGQNWIHDFIITCPEQYLLMINEHGVFILPELKSVKFEDNEANKAWSLKLRNQIIEMRDRGEWNESIEWTKVLRQLVKFQGISPNQENLLKRKSVKGHRLIRIKPAA